MAKIIIAIHGLGNKPSESVLKSWWKKSIQEGLRSIGYPNYFFKFELVYWADILYKNPLQPDIKDRKDPAFVDEPYMPANHAGKRKPGPIFKKIVGKLQKKLNSQLVDENMSIKYSPVVDLVFQHFFRELGLYYSAEMIPYRGESLLAKEAIRQELSEVLKKYQRHQILLIAHSMGTIIAFDVLSLKNPESIIDTLVTMGSPLGMPVIQSKILAERQITKNMLQIPDNISHDWYNFFDPDDNVSNEPILRDKFLENKKAVQIKDIKICNDYEFEGERNPHKSFGYLRAPEVALVIHEFLNRDRSQFAIRVSNLINKMLSVIVKK
ncbi:hypothetical protein JW964_23530 [candidate division KSB1 bacterium]|nr:hypothetical protein [candidate division KSB1 bacterium]